MTGVLILLSSSAEDVRFIASETPRRRSVRAVFTLRKNASFQLSTTMALHHSDVGTDRLVFTGCQWRKRVSAQPEISAAPVLACNLATGPRTSTRRNKSAESTNSVRKSMKRNNKAGGHLNPSYETGSPGMSPFDPSASGELGRKHTKPCQPHFRSETRALGTSSIRMS